MSLYSILRPLLFRLSAEPAHSVAVRAGKLGQLAGPVTRALAGTHLSKKQRATLRVRAFGLDFPSPIGIAAGLDKNAELVRLWSQIGCGFAEVGSVTALPSAGNPKPRAFRLTEDRALINRMGLCNEGAVQIARRLRSMKRPRDFPLGINIAKTHDPNLVGRAAVDDFVQSARLMLPHADFLVLNVSCPNTAEGKTFEDPDALAGLIDAVMAERARANSTVPILVKLSPPPDGNFDPSPIFELVDLALERGIAGFVATNTASDRAGLRTPAARLEKIGAGGVSGAPLRSRATAMTRRLREHVGDRAGIIGVGGIDSSAAALQRLDSGADLIEIYTGLVFEGPRLIRGIARALAGRALKNP